MKILSVTPKEVAIKIELTSSEIDHILEFLDNVKVNTQDNETLEKATTFVTDVFFKELNMLYEGLKKG